MGRTPCSSETADRSLSARAPQKHSSPGAWLSEIARGDDIAVRRSSGPPRPGERVSSPTREPELPPLALLAQRPDHSADPAPAVPLAHGDYAPGCSAGVGVAGLCWASYVLVSDRSGSWFQSSAAAMPMYVLIS
jgi:hypothetical protein